MLSFAFRIRDLLYGYAYLTRVERRVINHPLFQRLRHVRQNDVAFFVYPSLNISRFEHSVGCAVVAGKIAENVLRSPAWDSYSKAVNLDRKDFVQLVRLYALLHDLGHLPLSHLFEMAFEDWINFNKPGRRLREVCTEWFGGDGFEKLHEACGAGLIDTVLDEAEVPESLTAPLRRLMTTKYLEPDDPLVPAKQIVDSEIDADRVDATARDGILAGGEYGNYDIDRICSGVFVIPYNDGWRLAYSTKAVGSVEALLLDRCRTHTWIHFHHRVVAMKMAARISIQALLADGHISRESFPLDSPEVMCLRDDVWLWNLIRNVSEDDEPLAAAKRTLLYRDKESITLLWKNRATYHVAQEELRNEAVLRSIPFNEFGREYERWLSERMGFECRVYIIRFKPIGNKRVLLTDDSGEGFRGELIGLSSLVSSLEDIWKKEPQYFVVLFGKGSTEGLRRKWVQVTAEWLQQ